MDLIPEPKGSLSGWGSDSVDRDSVPSFARSLLRRPSGILPIRGPHRAGRRPLIRAAIVTPSVLAGCGTDATARDRAAVDRDTHSKVDRDTHSKDVPLEHVHRLDVDPAGGGL
jgi:hypothetical protein